MDANTLVPAIIAIACALAALYVYRKPAERDDFKDHEAPPQVRNIWGTVTNIRRWRDTKDDHFALVATFTPASGVPFEARLNFSASLALRRAANQLVKDEAEGRPIYRADFEPSAEEVEKAAASLLRLHEAADKPGYYGAGLFHFPELFPGHGHLSEEGKVPVLAGFKARRVRRTRQP